MAIKVWQQGDRPTAAQINEYKTVLDAANTALASGTGVPMQLPAEHIGEARFEILHVYRYLHFGSNGKLIDLSGAQDDVSLSEGENEVGVVDLEKLGWLAYGVTYQVEGVSWAQEDWEP